MCRAGLSVFLPTYFASRTVRMANRAKIAGKEISPTMQVADLEIDLSARTVKRSGQVIELTPREFALLELLFRNRGSVVSRAMIWQHLYGEQPDYTSNVIDVYI